MSNLGPVAWMAPESLSKQIYSRKSDAWSFGIVVWEVCTQETPHLGMQLIDLAVKIRDQHISPPLSPSFPSVLSKICQQCWLFDPDQRPDFTDICSVLQTAQRDTGRSAPNPVLPVVEPTVPAYQNIGGTTGNYATFQSKSSITGDYLNKEPPKRTSDYLNSSTTIPNLNEQNSKKESDYLNTKMEK